MSENPSLSLSYEHKSREQLIQEIHKLRTMLNAERERKQTGISETLRESERKYHTIFEQAAIGICRVSFHDARWIEFNDAFKNMLGYTKEELLQIPWPQITHPEDVDLDLIPFRQMAAGELESYTVEKRFIHKKGHHVWARLTLSLVRNAKEEPDYEIAVVENINERKQTEESLRRLSQFPGENPHPVLRIAADSTLLYANEAASDCLELLGSTGEHISAVLTALASKAQHSSQTVESEITLPDNRTFGFFAVRPHGEDYVNIYGIDLSKRKQVEAALRESEECFRSMFENNLDAMFLTDPDGRILDANPAACEMFSRTREEFIRLGRSATPMADPREQAEAIELRSHNDRIRREVTFLRKDGSKVETDLSSVITRNAAGDEQSFVVLRDITPLKKAQEALQRSEARWNAAIENFVEGIIIATEDEQVIHWNPAARRMYGFTRSDEGIEPLEKTPITFQLWTPDGIHMLELDSWPMRRIKRGEIVRHLELRLRRPDQGWEKVVSYSGAMVDTAAGERLIFLSVSDLTRQRTAEQSLRESEERLRLATDAAQLGVFEWDAQNDVVFWHNPRMFEIFGLSPQDRPLDRKQLEQEVIHPDDLFRFQREIIESMQNRTPFTGKYRIRRLNDGQWRWIEYLGTFEYAENGDVVRLLSVLSDITERKQVEEALKESESIYRSIGESIDYGVWICAPDGRNTYASDSFLKMVGLTQEQCSNFGWGDVLHPDDSERTIAAWQECVRTGGKWDIEHRFRGTDGQWHHVLARGVPVRNEQGEIIRWAGINLDINQRKQAEQELRKSEERLRMVLHASSMGTFEFNLHNREGQWNDVEYELLGLKPGYAPGNPETFFQNVHPEDIEALKAKWEAALQFGELDAEFRILRADGHERWLAGKGRFLSDNKDKSQVMRFLGVNFDITNRKLAEKQIKASLAEKEVLLKEIHHRVKNNLQIISSLVSLQSDTLTDERIREELNDVRDRVRSMALVHEKLYQTNDMASLDFAEYATSLMHTLWRSHSTLAVNVQIELAVEPVSLSIEAAVLCGLILNELASNALKHAFPNNSSGEVELGLKLDPATETVYLRIRDNGIGLPADFDWRQSESLGLRLVKILAGQLRGIVETETGPGTEFKIIFPLKGNKQ